MKEKKYLLDTSTLVELGKRLSGLRKISRYNTENEEQEGWTLAHTFSDLEESFRNITDILLPKLIDSKINDEETEEILLDIGEEFRHILYHIRDTRFYKYLFE